MSLRQETIHGIKWTTVAQVGKQGAQLVIVAVLARLLSPDDFGLLGMATVFTGFAQIFGDLGVSSALIQKQDVTEEHLSSAFWLNVLAGVILSFIFVLAAPLIALFYDKPQLKLMIMVMSLNFIVSSFTIIQQTIFQKEMNFKPLMLRDIIATIGSGVIGVICAFAGMGVWSLVAQLFAYSLINAILLWVLSIWRPKMIFSFSHIKSIFRFSMHMTGFSVLNYFCGNIDYLLIGKFLGTEMLGFYTLAYRLMVVPLQNVSWVISKVIFPAFSKIQNDYSKIHNAFIKVTKAIAFVSFPMLAMICIITPELVQIVFGEKWAPAIPVIQILCICGIIRSVLPALGDVRKAQGKTGLHLIISIGNLSFVSLAILLGIPKGIVAVAVSYTIAFWLWSYVEIYLTTRFIPFVKPSEFYRAFLLLIIGCIFMTCMTLFVMKFIALKSLMLTLSIKVFLSVVLYGSFLVLTKQIDIFSLANTKRKLVA